MQTAIDYNIENRRSLNTHKWFLYTLINADIKHASQEAEALKKKVQMYIKILLIFFLVYMILPKLNRLGHITFTLVMILLITIYETYLKAEECLYKKAPTVYLRFTCPDIFYQNRHYLFSGTKAELERAFHDMRSDIDATKKDPYFGRGDHDELLDMPLDTFCNSLCECLIRTAPNDNYNCSHWNLHSYDSEDDLKKQVKELEKLNMSPDYRGFKNEIFYI